MAYCHMQFLLFPFLRTRVVLSYAYYLSDATVEVSEARSDVNYSKEHIRELAGFPNCQMSSVKTTHSSNSVLLIDPVFSGLNIGGACVAPRKGATGYLGDV